MKPNNQGFSLIETVVAMAILGAFTVSICTCLVMSLRMNKKTSTLMQEQMAVSSAVEELMAEGIKPNAENSYSYSSETDKVSILVEDKGNYCEVTVTSKDVDDDPGNVTVVTQIRKAVD